MKKDKLIKLLPIAVVATVIVVIIGIISSFSGEKSTDVMEDETKKTTVLFGQSDEKHIALQYPLDADKQSRAVATLENLSTGEIFTDNTYVSAYSFLVKDSGRYLASVSLDGEVLVETMIYVTDDVSFYHVPMYNAE